MASTAMGVQEPREESAPDLPEELVGLWESGPYDYGAMESTTLALMADGRGWTAVEGLGGLLQLRRLTWCRAKAGVIELRYRLSIDIASERQARDDEFVRAHYTLREDSTPLRSDFPALHLTEHVDFARQFGLLRREVTTADDPTCERVPYGGP